MHNEFTNMERAEVLVQALPNIKKYSGKTVVIKYGGNAILKGMNYLDGATARDRNTQIGGHRA